MRLPAGRKTPDTISSIQSDQTQLQSYTLISGSHLGCMTKDVIKRDKSTVLLSNKGLRLNPLRFGLSVFN